MGLLDFQEKNLKKIKDELKCNHKCQIVGNIGDGRSFTLRYLEDEYCVIIIENDNKDLTYMPIINALKKYEEHMKSYDISFSLGLNISKFSLNIKVEQKKLDALELEILKAITKLRKRKKVMFVIRYEQLNPSIANLLSKIDIKKKKSFFSEIYEARFVYLTSKALDSSEYFKINVVKLSSSTQSYESILDEMGLNDIIGKTLSNQEKQFIFSLVEDNLGCLKNLIDEMNNHIISFSDNTDKNNSIYTLINKRYKNDIQRVNINDLLSFCSFSEDFLLSENDLAFLLECIEINDLKSFIMYAKANKLVSVSNDKIQVFIFLLKNIYKEQFNLQKGKIYKKLCSMISYLYPSNYKQKINYARLANDVNLETYLAQYYMQQIRENGECIELESHKDFKYYSLLSAYKQAYAYMLQKEYSKIESLFFDFKVLPLCLSTEISLLICQAETKSLSREARINALTTLTSINETHLDGYLKYRLECFKIVTNIHNGNYVEARICYESLVQYLADNITNHPSEELNCLFYTLCRKSNMIYNFQSALISIEKAKNYFNNRIDLPQDNYFALVNYFGISIRNMDLAKAKSALDSIEKLKTNHCYRNFSREYIFENNLLIYNYLSNKPISEILISFKILLNNLPKSADRFLIAINYAVFVALNNELDRAIEILKHENYENNIDSEGVYMFRHKLNFTIFNYIKDNKNREKFIGDLNKLDLNINYPNREYMINERNLVIETMKLPCSNSCEWIDNFNKFLPDYRSKNGYELGFVITPLFHWSDD